MYAPPSLESLLHRVVTAPRWHWWMTPGPVPPTTCPQPPRRKPAIAVGHGSYPTFMQALRMTP